VLLTDSSQWPGLLIAIHEAAPTMMTSSPNLNRIGCVVCAQLRSTQCVCIRLFLDQPSTTKENRLHWVYFDLMFLGRRQGQKILNYR
jgi:hypothetical protein